MRLELPGARMLRECEHRGRERIQKCKRRFGVRQQFLVLVFVDDGGHHRKKMHVASISWA
ncbi:hypothetical protein BKG75_10610 [Mycobacteroides chelonae]|nr:hypothetical protein BKG75_10610 [Mycobacteroides chelonae]